MKRVIEMFDVGQVQRTENALQRQRGPLGGLLKDIEVGVAVYLLVLAVFALARRPWGLGVLGALGSWIGVTVATQWNCWATLPLALAIGGLIWPLAATVRKED